MKRICKGTFTAILSIILIIISSVNSSVFAATPLSLALELTKDTMQQGDTMNVSVALQNYDSKYTDNHITTVIVEVSVDTEMLSVDKSSIKVELDEGSGMGFSVAQMKDGNNVELQYLNVGDPLDKGTKDLYTFDITALSDIENLLDCIKITYAVMQDGTKATSEKLTVVPFVMVNGKAVEQGDVDEKYTSEYGTVEVANEVVSEVVSQAATGNTSGETTTSAADMSTNGTISSEDGIQTATDGRQLESDATEEAETDSNGETIEKSQVNSEEEDTTIAEKGTEPKEIQTKESKSDKKGNVFIKVAILAAIVVVIGTAIYFYRKKKKQNENS